MQIAESKARNIELAKSWIKTYNQGPGWVDECFHKDVEYVVMPSTPFPEGDVLDFSRTEKAAQDTWNMFPGRKTSLLNLIAEGSEVVIEVEWRGTPVNGTEDDEVVVRGIIWMTFKEEKIIRQVEYLSTLTNDSKTP